MKKQNNNTLKMKAILLTALLAAGACYGYAQRDNQLFTDFTESEYAVETPSTPASQPQSAAASRNWCRHEISLWGAGGWSSLYYRPVVGQKGKLPLGGEFGLGYTFYFTQHIGLLLGAELAYYQNKINFAGVYDNYNTLDISPYTAKEGDDYINFRYRTDNYTERQTMWALNVPLIAQFQTNRWGSHRLYGGLGVKLGIPLNTKFSGKQGTITSAGYYYAYDQISDEEKSQLGYGQFDNQSAADKLKVGLAVIGTAELGVKWYLGRNIDLYTGVYGEYGINDILRGKRDKQFVELSGHVPEAGTFHLNSVLVSQNNDGIQDLKLPSNASNAGTTRAIADKLAPVAFGLKLRLGFGVGCPVPASEQRNGRGSGDGNSNGNPHLEAARRAAEAARQAAETTLEIANTLKDHEHAPAPGSDTRRSPVYDNGQQEIDDYLAARRNQQGQRDRQARRLGSINYNLNIAALTADQERTLDGYVSQMQQNPELKMDITGHACNLGNYDYNMWIGQERADLAKDYIVSRGVRPSRIATFTKGDTEPIVPNNSDVNRKINRRLVIDMVR